MQEGYNRTYPNDQHFLQVTNMCIHMTQITEIKHTPADDGLRKLFWTPKHLEYVHMMKQRGLSSL